MKPTNRPRVKICCISSLEEAELAIECGASALGLVSHMPSGPGVIDEELIPRIAARVPPPVATFLLTSKQDCEGIIRQQRACRTTCIQICDRLTSGDYRDLKQALPGISIVQVIHVVGRESIDEAIAVSAEADAILLDSGNQSLAIRELGGTGRIHDWAISCEIRERVSVPIFLAGGLNVSNVRRAIHEVGPFAVDVCSGVRTHGKLDALKLRSFFAEIAACASEATPVRAHV
jgi:phosphoribosylanthranilate isomerase